MLTALRPTSTLQVTAVSTKTNTTRGEVIGVLTKGDTQILFYDTPGVVGPEHYHNPDHERKVKSAWATASFCDLLLLLVDAERQVYRPDHRVDELISLFPSQEVGLPDRPRPPSVLVLNKMDLFPVDERKLVLPLLEKFQQKKAFDEVFLVSALKHRGTDPIMQYLMDKAKPGQWLVPPGKKTTSTVPVRALEIVRGHLYKHLHKEMPYRIDLRPVSIRYFADGSVRIEQEIVVKHRSQRQIVVGRKGAKIGQIGIAARKDLQANLGQKVHLILNVVLRSDKK
mmetsp:Transcript_5297/g.33276  ORF Transcript_5297/g.33276 Transcript_5297/m.33276 type:complete len:283 (-) Transcript_5297:81-929(-)